MKVYTRKNKPKQSTDDISVSVDIIAMSEDGLLNIGYFDFKTEKWIWHTDTLIDMDELVDGEPVQFKWIYTPEELL